MAEGQSPAPMIHLVKIETTLSETRSMLRSLRLATLVLGLIAAIHGAPAARATDILYVANLGNNTVSRYDAANGSYQSSFNAPGAAGIALNASGNAFVTDYGNSVVNSYNTAGQLLSTNSSTSLLNPIGIAFDSQGNYWVAGQQPYFDGTNPYPAVYQYNTSGTYLSQAAWIGGTNGYADSIAINSAGDLFMSVPAFNKVVKYNAGGSASNYIVGGVVTPTGLAFDSAGYLYVACSGDNTIRKYDTSANLISTISTNLNSVRGIAFDSAGNLFAANAGNSTISKFSPTGTFLSSISTNVNVPIGIAFQPVSVPEPSTYALCAIATGVLAAAARRRKAKLVHRS
jgi:sugar lactone lactonase YvrE